MKNTDKKGFKLYIDSIGVIDKLSDDEAGQLFKHIVHYVDDKNPILNNEKLELVFYSIQIQLERDRLKYEEVCEKNRINALKRGK